MANANKNYNGISSNIKLERTEIKYLMANSNSKIKVEPQKFRILMVEDNEINVRIMQEILEKTGYQVDCATNGQDGLKCVEESKPDLILLDVMMPVMGGFEVCSKLKANAETTDIPIIFMTAATDTKSIVQGFELGAVDYIKKPVQPQEMLARIKTHLTVRALQMGLNNEISNREELISDLTSFTHMMAHDLKNPISNILGFSEVLINDGKLLKEQTLIETVQYIKQSGEKAYEIIDSLLLLANIRLKDVPSEPVNLQLLILEAKTHFTHKFETENIEFNYSGNWPWVLGYSLWIEEVLANLISNAIKYGGTPPHIELKYKQIENNFIKISVKDNGEGLHPEQIGKLFQPFVKLHSSRDGHGLGLSIVKRIIEKMGGVVGAESRVGIGSSFYFTLPLAESSSANF